MPISGMGTNNELYMACFKAKGYSVLSEEEWELQKIRERETRLRALWLQREYSWLMSEKDALDTASTQLNRDRTDTPQRREALAAYQRRLTEYQRRLTAYEARRTQQ